MLKGIHHITAITGDSPANIDFYVRVLGLRLVKKTVNFDVPDVYHLYYGDESGSPGSVLTFFEYPGARRGRHGSGMIHTIQWGVAGKTSLDFWERRMSDQGVPAERVNPGLLRFTDPEGLGIELTVDDAGEPDLTAVWPDIPATHALQGFTGVRTYDHGATDLKASDAVLTDLLGFEQQSSKPVYTLSGGARGAHYAYDDDPGPGAAGAGTVHHIAWACEPDEQETWRSNLEQSGLRPTAIIDRTYFRSIYFREPSGVLFEIATLGPGFAIDEPEEALGEGLMLPPQYAHLREQLTARLTPLRNPRQIHT